MLSSVTRDSKLAFPPKAVAGAHFRISCMPRLAPGPRARARPVARQQSAWKPYRQPVFTGHLSRPPHIYISLPTRTSVLRVRLLVERELEAARLGPHGRPKVGGGPAGRDLESQAGTLAIGWCWTIGIGLACVLLGPGRCLLGGVRAPAGPRLCRRERGALDVACILIDKTTIVAALRTPLCGSICSQSHSNTFPDRLRS